MLYLSIALTLVALAAWDAFRRWLSARTVELSSEIETELRDSLAAQAIAVATLEQGLRATIESQEASLSQLQRDLTNLQGQVSRMTLGNGLTRRRGLQQ